MHKNSVYIFLYTIIALALILGGCQGERDPSARSNLGSLEIRTPSASIRRENSAESAVIAELKAGHELAILSEREGWYRVRLPDGKTGWVWNESVNLVDDESLILGARIIVESANLKDEGSSESATTATLSKGDRSTLLRMQGDWYLLSLADGTQGWIRAEEVKVEPRLRIQILRGGVEAKAGPGREYRSTSLLIEGDQFGLYGRKGSWYRIVTHEGTEGWVRDSEAQLIPMGELRVSAAQVKIHEGRGETYKAISQAEEGEILGFINKRGSWYQVETSDGGNGWVEAQGVEVEAVGSLEITGSGIVVKSPSSRTETLAIDSEVTIIESVPEGYRVRLPDGRETTISGEALPSREEEQLVIKSSLANVRSGPGVNFDVSGQARGGQELGLLGQERGWYQVRLPDGKDGWVSARVAELVEEGSAGPYRKGKVVSTVKETPLDSSSAPQSPLAILDPSTRLPLLGEEGGWYRVRLPSREGLPSEEGWVRKDSARVLPTFSVSPVDAGASISDIPDVEGSEIKVAEAGETLEVVDESEGWYGIRLPPGEGLSLGKVGWVAKDRVIRNPVGRTEIVSKSGAMIKAGPGPKYKNIGRANAGEEMDVIEGLGTWVRVRSAQGEEGWVSKEENKTLPVDQVVVSSPTASVRKGPTASYSEIAKVVQGDRLDLLGEMGDSINVRLSDGREGWMSQASAPGSGEVAKKVEPKVEEETRIEEKKIEEKPVTDEVERERVQVKSQVANVRDGPGSTNKIVNQVKVGDDLTVLDKSGVWYQVESEDGKTGWIWEGTLDLPGEEGVVAKASESTPQASEEKPIPGQIPSRVRVTSTLANVRTGPGTNNRVLDTVKGDSELDVTDQQGNWYQVELADGRRAWISKGVTEPISEEIKVAVLPKKEEPKVEVEVENSQGVVIAPSARLREGPGEDYAQIGEAARGDRLALSGRTGNWYKANTNDNLSIWVGRDDIKVLGPPRVEDTLDDMKVVISSSLAAIHSGPDPDYATIAEASKGDKFKALGRTGDWYRIDIPDKEGLSKAKGGWVSERDVQVDRIKETYAQVGINLRKGPGLDYDVVSPLRVDEGVEVTGKAGSWYKVAGPDGKEGWVWRGNFSEGERKSIESKSPPSGRTRVQSPALREEASLDSPEVAKLKPGEGIDIIDTSGNWYKVKTSYGEEGWAWGDARTQNELGEWKDKKSSTAADNDARVIFDTARDFYNQEAYKLAKGNFIKLVQEYPRSSHTSEAFEFLSGIDDKIKSQEIDSLIAKLDPSLMQMSIGHIVHVSLSGEVFVDLGSDHGIEEGKELKVLRKGTEDELSVIKINQVHSGKLSSGKVVTGVGAGELGKGDIVKKTEGS